MSIQFRQTWMPGRRITSQCTSGCTWWYAPLRPSWAMDSLSCPPQRVLSLSTMSCAGTMDFGQPPTEIIDYYSSFSDTMVQMQVQCSLSSRLTYKMPSMSQGYRRKLWAMERQQLSWCNVVILQANAVVDIDYYAQRFCNSPSLMFRACWFSYKGFDRVSPMYSVFRTRSLHGSQFCDPFAYSVAFGSSFISPDGLATLTES